MFAAGDGGVHRGVTGGHAVVDKRAPSVVDDDALDAFDLVGVHVFDRARNRHIVGVCCGAQREGEKACHGFNVAAVRRLRTQAVPICG